jgi:hypothetical protein
MKEEYYVYILQNPKKPLRFSTDKYGLEYEPFYVGKGKGDRSEVHYNNLVSRNDSHNGRLWAELSKLRSYGVEPVVSKIYFTDDESEAYEKEGEVISHYGIRYKDGILVNTSLGKAGGWGGESNPTYDRMQAGTHNFQVGNPQINTPQIAKLKKMILEVSLEKDLKDDRWLRRAGYSNFKSLRIGIERIISRDNLNYYIEDYKLIKGVKR